MALLWAVGPAALVVGVVLSVGWRRHMATAADELHTAVDRLTELRRSVSDLRVLGGELASRTGRPRDD